MRTISQLEAAIRVAGLPDTCPSQASKLLSRVRKDVMEANGAISGEERERLLAAHRAATEAAQARLGELCNGN
jgi:hypothetical protein